MPTEINENPAFKAKIQVVFDDDCPEDIKSEYEDVLNFALNVCSYDVRIDEQLNQDMEITFLIEPDIKKTFEDLQQGAKNIIKKQIHENITSGTISFTETEGKLSHITLIKAEVFENLGGLVATINHELQHIFAEEEKIVFVSSIEEEIDLFKKSIDSLLKINSILSKIAGENFPTVKNLDSAIQEQKSLLQRYQSSKTN